MRGESDMTCRADITVRKADAARESGAFSFIPHSAEADDFLFFQFGLIGGRDLTAQDADMIVRRAERRGFIVRDLRHTCGHYDCPYTCGCRD
jgi:hypothetical protein